MKKILSVILCFTMLFALSACSKKEEKGETNEQKVEALLNEGKFADAYKTAESESLKNLVMAENLFSCYCYHTNKKTEAKVELLEGYFGQVEASENDEYVPNDDIWAFDNYAKLEEGLSGLHSKNFLDDYYYGIVKDFVGDEVELYTLISLSKKDNTYNTIITWTSLEYDNDDGNVEALYKYIGRKLTEDGAQISDKAIKRINKNYLSDSPKEVEFEIKS